MKNLKVYLTAIVLTVIFLLGGGWWFFSTVGEREKPLVKFGEDLRSMGRQKTINITFADLKSGLRNISVAIVQDNKSHVLAAEAFPQKGIKQKTLSLAVAASALKLHDGQATLSVVAVDYSVFKNKIAIDRPISIDLIPPQIYLLTSTNNINPGGCCLVAFRTSEPTVTSGVQVNNNFSPAYPATFAGKPANLAYFALPMVSRGEGANIRIVARDGGENETSLALPSLIRSKKFRSDKMQLTDKFLNQKMLDFQPLPPELQGKSPLEIFGYVNGQLRLANEATLRELCRQSEPRQLWEGTFLRMKDASPMAQFGDKRTYIYENRVIGESVHLGVDLASLANAPVEASNNGIVKYTGNLGIYGNAILVDHGQGIFSAYGHLSVINVQAGQTLKKGDVMGKTGATGLAAGDHLHFGLLIGGQFVNPVEWWDPHWIKDNITDKLNG
jgi:murein DD-endopeptidase MepM/ murein hydrolase activator NlpD